MLLCPKRKAQPGPKRSVYLKNYSNDEVKRKLCQKRKNCFLGKTKFIPRTKHLKICLSFVFCISCIIIIYILTLLEN
jgi:hypothetical protein